MHVKRDNINQRKISSMVQLIELKKCVINVFSCQITAYPNKINFKDCLQIQRNVPVASLNSDLDVSKVINVINSYDSSVWFFQAYKEATGNIKSWKF